MTLVLLFIVLALQLANGVECIPVLFFLPIKSEKAEEIDNTQCSMEAEGSALTASTLLGSHKVIHLMIQR